MIIALAGCVLRCSVRHLPISHARRSPSHARIVCSVCSAHTTYRLVVGVFVLWMRYERFVLSFHRDSKTAYMDSAQCSGSSCSIGYCSPLARASAILCRCLLAGHVFTGNCRARLTLRCWFRNFLFMTKSAKITPFADLPNIHKCLEARCYRVRFRLSTLI